MKSTESGRTAEVAAAEYLEKKGHKVLARNWRNKWCEIDLVTRDRDGVIRIIEVKYRRSSDYGSGFDYITADKSARLRRAALSWLVEQRLDAPIVH